LLFGSASPSDLRARSMAVVEAARGKEHPVYPEAWEAWCGKVLENFQAGKSPRPLMWNRPEMTGGLLKLLFLLTSREWRPGTLVRDASVAMGLDSKALERHRAALEAALGGFFQQPGKVGLEALNLMGANSLLMFHGPLVLELPGGPAEPSRGLDHGSSVTAADLERAERITTTARVLLTVENVKSPFRHAVAANAGQGMLVVASSFPTRAVRLLLEKLPVELPHYHFGDTDAAGYLILSKLRAVRPARRVLPWRMDWRDQPGSPALTEYDRRVAARLLDDPEMADVREDLRRMLAAGRKGDFEQEGRLGELEDDAGFQTWEGHGPAYSPTSSL
jgi:hypothetical protein